MKKIDYLKIEEMLDRGYTWEMIKKELPWFTDSDRKRYYGFKDGLEMFNRRFNEERMTEREQRLRLERKVLSYERSINNEQIRDISLNKMLSHQMQEALLNSKPINIYEPSINTEELDEHHIVTMSDLHYDGDIETLEDVFNKAYSEIHKRVRENNIKHLYIVEMGDTIEGAGNLRPSQAQAVKAGMMSQLIDVLKAYVEFLKDLRKHVDITFVVVTSSNHTQLRLMGSKQNELVEEDLMRLFPVYMEAIMPTLDIVHAQKPELEIDSYQLLFMHGHTTKKGNFEKELSEISSEKNQLYDFLFLGHYHHLRAIEEGVARNDEGILYDKLTIVVPGLAQKRTDYEKDLKVSSTPGIGFFRFTPETGRMQTEKIPIITKTYDL